VNPKIPVYHYDGGREPIAMPLQERNLEQSGEILCLDILWNDTIRISDKVEKGDRLNGVRVESCKEDGLGYLVEVLPVSAHRKFKEGGMIVHHKKVAQIQPKFSEYKCLALLEEPYYRLAIRRTTKALTAEVAMAPLNTLFEFSKTPEKHDWWWSVMSGDNPELPELSKKELESEFVKPNIKS
jgi:hypothetical protein